MPLNIDQKLVVGAALAIPVLYQFFEWNWSIWILAALAGYGWYTFDNTFINRAEIERRNVPELGPQQPFPLPERQYDIDPATGIPIPRYQQPYSQPPRR